MTSPAPPTRLADFKPHMPTPPSTHPLLTTNSKMANPLHPSQITPEHIIDLITPQSVSLSPTGDKGLYAASPYGKKSRTTTSSLWLASTSTANSARQITSGIYNDYAPQWRPDGSAAAFLSDRANPGKSCALYLQSLVVGEPVALTDTGNEKGIESFGWSPDGKGIAFLRADEKAPEQVAREAEGNDEVVYHQHWEYARLRVLDVETREVRTLVECDMHVAGFGWSPNSSRIVYMLKADTVDDTPVDPNGMGTRIEIVDISTGNRTRVLDFPGQLISGYDVRPAMVWRTETEVQVTAPMDPMSCARSFVVWRIDVEAKTYEHIAFGEKNDVRLLHGGAGWAAASILEGLEDSICLVDGTILYSAPEELKAWDVVKKAEGSFAVVVITNTVASPPEVYSVDVSTGTKALQLSSHGSSIAAANLATSHVLECRSYDQKYFLQGLYVTPGNSEQKPEKSLPTAVLVHGGPYFRGTDSFAAPHFPWSSYILASGKYGVLIANYRGNSSQGDTHARAVFGMSGTGEHDDILALVDEGIAQGFVDPKNVLIGGWSYGGVLSFIAAVRNGRTTAGEKKDWKYKAVIPGAGVCDQEQMAVGSDHIFYSSQMAGGNPWTTDWRTETGGRKGSAVWQMKEGRENLPPCLLLHGQADDRVPISQSWAFERGCRHYGVECTLVTYPREGHMLEERGHLVDMLRRVRGFCDKHIGGGS